MKSMFLMTDGGKVLVRRLMICVVVVLCGFGARGDEGLDFFEKRVRPVLAKRCYECHGPTKQESGLRWDHIDFIKQGGERGAVVVGGDLKASRMVEAIGYEDVHLQMPPKGRLAKSEIEVLEKWVLMGAPWPDEPTPMVKKVRGFDLAGRKAEHWAWGGIKTPEFLPEVADAAWSRNEIDRYVLAKLEATGLKPTVEADKRTLIRRAYFDVVGLAPTVAEVEAFLADESVGAWEKVVDGLLGDKGYGERWGRHWLDLMRYAESRGHEGDDDAPNAYEYRDYVIRALNADVPYDDFVREHLAGDLIEKPRLHKTEGYNESILGTGFWFLGEWMHSPVDIRQDELDRFDNMIDVASKTFLGLTVACARCHDHKFDAISAADYYAMAGYLQSTNYRQVSFETLEHNREVAKALGVQRAAGGARLGELVAKVAGPVVDRMGDYLLGARRVLMAGGQENMLEIVALEDDLSLSVLGEWVKHLEVAREDASDPFHAFALMTDVKESGGEREIRQLVGEWNRRDVASARAKKTLKGMRVLADYRNGRAKGDAWYADGFAFGDGPVEVGTLLIGDDATAPLSGVVHTAGVHRDMDWKGLTYGTGRQTGTSSLDKFRRSGQTFRTETFVSSGKELWYLVRGGGHAYLNVDSHHMVRGPLHKALVTSWKGDDKGVAEGQLRWARHRGLAQYDGHNAHVEFSPMEDGEMAVLMVVESDVNPGMPIEANGLLKGLVGETEAVDQLAAGYGRVFAKVNQDLGANDLQTADEAELADWLVKHMELFAPRDGAFRMLLVRAGQAVVEDHRLLVESIQRESRTAMAMQEGSGVDEHVLLRGGKNSIGDVAPRGLLVAIGGKQAAAGAGSGRMAWVDRMLDDGNPFVARVMVNRVWHHLMGRGIVGTVDNFGVLGDRPTHPELLDWLAGDFRKSGWSVKGAIKRVMMSSTYRMDSKPVEGAAGEVVAVKDPDNLLLHRMNVKRLQGEAIRDAMLQLSGELDGAMFGVSVPVYLSDFMEGRGRPKKSGPMDGAGRRSIYTAIRRNFLPNMMLAFDMPIPFNAMGKRSVSNVPAQALILMNDPFVLDQARLWAKGLLAMEGVDDAGRVRRLYEMAFSREPDAGEMREALEFVEGQRGAMGESAGGSRELAWGDLCHVVMNVKEFIFIR